jgi:hypothetical protein
VQVACLSDPTSARGVVDREPRDVQFFGALTKNLVQILIGPDDAELARSCGDQIGQEIAPLFMRAALQ